jgi:hypothetical protein
VPASSLSAALNTGVYLFATGLFLALTVPILDQVYKASEAQTLHSLTDGLRMEVDSLVPGMKTKFVFYSPQSALIISLRHHSIVASIDNLVLVESVKWTLPETKLVPGTDYTLSLVGNGVSVEESRGS